MIKKITESECFLAGDKSFLRELLHPKNDEVMVNFSLAHAYVEVGEATLPHRLAENSETYFILEGNGEISIDGEIFLIEKYDTVFVPKDAIQFVSNLGNSKLEFLCIVSPPWSGAAEEILK